MAHRLRDALRVTAQPRQRRQLGRQRQRHLLRLQRRLEALGQALQQRRELERRLLQRRVAARQARQVRQFVGDAHQVADLAFHDAARAQPAARVGVGQAQQLDAVGQRRQRIAQVVRESGEERVALGMGGLGVADRAVALRAHRGQRGLGVGQRGLDALQLIVGGRHP